ncbi:MAG: hypothetical protein HXK79_04585 [Lachnospiraceae bacterium]|nr:hypothetical protein [Lachnospiraceae bacterium]
MDFTLRELDKKETLSLYKRYLTKFFDEKFDGFLISESAIRWLIARKICSCYGLFDDKKHLLCFGLFVGDIEQRVMLLDYFVVLKKYRGYNYPEIFFGMLKEVLIPKEEEAEEKEKEVHKEKEKEENKASDNKFPLGIFIELEGVGKTDEKAIKKREMALDFYRKIGAYMTDILPVLSDEEYNVLFLPVNAKPSRSELKAEFLGIYREILPSFKDKKKYITRLTEEVDGLV